MPPIAKYTKQDFLNASYEIVKNEGLEQLNARKLAKKLNCSVQPIFSNFENMEDLKTQVLAKISEEFYNFITTKIDSKIPEYKQIGINYIKFAKEEPILFNLLFMQAKDINSADFVNMNNDFKSISKVIGNTTKSADIDIKKFHTKMWLFVHGIATLVAKNTNFFTDQQISDLLSNQFQALMLLEENPNNKWVLKNELKDN